MKLKIATYAARKQEIPAQSANLERSKELHLYRNP